MKYSKIKPKDKKAVRQKYYILQKGLCVYCKGSLDFDAPEDVQEKKIDWEFFPEGFLNSPVHIHHNHKTDKVIGIVHAKCNAVLWQYHNE